MKKQSEITRAMKALRGVDGWKSFWCRPPWDYAYLMYSIRLSGQHIEVYKPNTVFPKINIDGRLVKLKFVEKFRLLRLYRHLSKKYEPYENSIVSVEITDE